MLGEVPARKAPPAAYDLIMKWTRLLVPALLFLPPATRAAGDAPLDRATLRGLKSVNIVLDPLDPGLLRAGLTMIDLQTRLTERLREAHIPVDQSAVEFLGLRIVAVRGNRGPFALAFNLGVYQPVQLIRDKSVRAATSTWDVETVLMADPKVLQQASGETIDELAGRFVAAWRSVNQQ